MADAKTIQKLKDLVEEIEALEPKGDCQAYVRGLLLEQMYKADELLEPLVADSVELPPLKLKQPRQKKGSE